MRKFCSAVFVFLSCYIFIAFLIFWQMAKNKGSEPIMIGAEPFSIYEMNSKFT